MPSGFNFPPLESQLKSRSASFFASIGTTPEEVMQPPVSDYSNGMVQELSSVTSGTALNDDELPSSVLPSNSSLHPPSAFDGFSYDQGAAMRQFAKRLIRKAGLNEKLAQEFEEFLMMSEAEQRLAQFAISLQIRASLDDRKKSQAQTYQVPEELKSTIKTYARAALLSPTITSYRGNVEKHILAAMQDLNVHSLPETNEVAQVRKVVQEIQTALTNFRSVIKSKLKASLPVGSLTRNIGDLAHAIIGNNPIQVTLQHYIRFAFLRWAVEDTPTNVSDDDFWVTVDATINDIRTSCKTEAAIARCLTHKYEEDKLKYGDPAETAHVVSEPKDVQAWQTTVARHAGNVQGNLLQMKKKRKVAAVDEV
ncbi:hypothetical protein GALMADRAFT_249787 [Galerina marginata CBS 339.88]|uniref:Uncharacterized protein n=1 Tax=Galerina marginata (strain CBS 339.88) TaxID=685588 RepID=A0A067T7A6_GALM3|nr:hypothetical protein GALMADRAFT_249787 [Galerina marginata CBS 339.88]